MGVSLKFIFAGDMNVGKTSLVKRYTDNVFSDRYKATMGCDFGSKELESAGRPWQGRVVTIQAWDIAGADRFRETVVDGYFRGAHGVFVIYDKTDKRSFDGAGKWKELLSKKVESLAMRLPNGSPIPIVLIANKSDLPDEGTKMEKAESDKYIQDNEYAGFFETSAKVGSNVNEAVEFLAQQVWARDQSVFDPSPPTGAVSFVPNQQQKSSSGCAC